MKMKQLFLGLTVVALMAACGKKENTEAPAVETPATNDTEVVMEEPTDEIQAEEPVATAAPAKATAKPAAVPATAPAKAQPAPAATTTKAEPVDPCDQITKDYEALADQYVIKMKNRTASPQALKAANDIKHAADQAYAKAKDCVSNAEYKARIQKAFLKMQSVK